MGMGKLRGGIVRRSLIPLRLKIQQPESISIICTGKGGVKNV